MRSLPEVTKEEWEEAKTDHDKACEIYRRGSSDDETWEERKERIRRFRCGGY